ncbi:MAG TPA: hypothetical protein VIJ39_10720 [Solirubrobacteraceae bacterium]
MIGLVHLVWGPLGPAPLRRFLDSYEAHPAGIEHELTIVLNGVEQAEAASPGLRDALSAELARIEHHPISLELPLLDLAAYGHAAGESSCSRLCFLNSYSTILADDWLARLSHALDGPDVGIAGATGSWESQAEWIRGKARFWPYQLAQLRPMRRDYPRFPNPHIRTTAFMLERSTLPDLGLEGALDKRATYLLESGHHSITRQVLDSGRRVVVVDREGSSHDLTQWPESHTYRSGAQQGLLVGDRRTEDWQLASPGLRRRLARDAWGERA